MGHAPELEKKESFVGRWMDLLRPGFERIRDITDEAERLEAFEKQAVLVSLENLMTFPFVIEKVEDGTLELHGLWTDIGEGGLQVYDAKTDRFADA
jgi:carbonic anhydrase